MALQVRAAVKVLPQRTLVVVESITMVTLVPSTMSNVEGMSNVHAVPHSSTRDGAQTSEGGVVSRTVMVWPQVLLFPQASVALQIRVAAKLAPQTMLVVVERMATVTLGPSARSNATG